MNQVLEDIKQTMNDLLGVEPRSVVSDEEAKNALVWHQLAKDAIKQAEDAFKGSISPLDKAHKDAVKIKKDFLAKIESAVSRVRPSLANWIYSGHKVEGAYTRTAFNITIKKPDDVPREYWSPDVSKITDFVKKTDGKVPVSGVSIEPIAVLYAGKEKE